MSFLKYCLGVRRQVSNIAVLAWEFADITKILRLVCKNWFQIVNFPTDSLLYDSYLWNIILHSEEKGSWLQTVH